MKRLLLIALAAALTAAPAHAAFMAQFSGVLASYNAPKPPNVPTSVSATAGNTQNTVSWTASAIDGTHDAATSYTLYGGTSASPTTPIYTGSATSYTHTGLTNGTPYYYRATASNASGTSGYSSPDATATPAIIYLAHAEFDSGTVDTGFSTVTSGTGSVTSNSPTGYATINASGSNSPAAVVKTTALPSNKIFTVEVKGKVNTAANGSTNVYLLDLASAPTTMTGATATTAIRAAIEIAAVFDDWLIQYQNPSDTFYRLNGAGSWQTATAWQASPATTRGTEYQMIFTSDGTNLACTIKSADGSTTIANGSIPWSSIKTVSNSLWLAVGQLETDTGTGAIGTFDYIRVQ